MGAVPLFEGFALPTQVRLGLSMHLVDICQTSSMQPATFLPSLDMANICPKTRNLITK